MFSYFLELDWCYTVSEYADIYFIFMEDDCKWTIKHSPDVNTPDTVYRDASNTGIIG